MFRIIVLFAMLSVVMPGNAFATDTALEFVQQLEGKFRGKGEAVIPISQKVERVGCSVLNTFQVDTQTLVIHGKCATTQGKSNVKGSLQVTDDGVAGSFLSPFADSTITQSSSVFQEGRLIVSTSIVNNSTGNLSRLRQIISKNEEGGFTAVFQKFENASDTYHDSGTVVFMRLND
ncbi:MAG: hypothetical protein ACR2O3_02040 [Rhizobiaceae bacterium]